MCKSCGVASRGPTRSSTRTWPGGEDRGVSEDCDPADPAAVADAARVAASAVTLAPHTMSETAEVVGRSWATVYRALGAEHSPGAS